jgi:hypothetical protein
VDLVVVAAAVVVVYWDPFVDLVLVGRTLCEENSTWIRKVIGYKFLR